MKQPLVSVVLATMPGREEQLARAQAAYRRETPLLEMFVYEASRYDLGWMVGANQATGWYIHFATDQLEPHPGWSESARACVLANRIPTPTLYSVDGELVHGYLPVDWQREWFSEYPTMSKPLMDTIGPPPFASDMTARFARRVDYAFTLHTD